MKLSDFVIKSLSEMGLRHAFGMSGGAAVHLFDSVARETDMGLTCVSHEQSASIAADAYARISGNPGVCIVTSGPGATNLLTGVCCSYYDSVPSLMLTGQVATHRLKGDRPVRQVGFQETDILSIFASVTKSVAQLRVPNEIAGLMSDALSLALSDRPGPVVIDLPDDLQRAEVEMLPAVYLSLRSQRETEAISDDIEKLMCLIEAASRPVIVLGGGLTTPDAISATRNFLSHLAVPVLQTWAGLDVVPADWPHRYGTFGVYGNRLGNFIVQHADLLICLGTRLSQNLTGGLLKEFAPNAHIAMIDVDAGEMNKFDGKGIEITTRICCRLEFFLRKATEYMIKFSHPDLREWHSVIAGWQRELPDDLIPIPDDNIGYVDAPQFVRVLSEFLAEDEVIVVDTGGTLTWTCNNIALKSGQRLLSAWNFTPMGYAIPACLGVHAAAPGRPLTCIIGDGGLQLCLGELATILRYEIPVKIFLFNNHSHGIQKQTLETWLGGNYVGVDADSGLGLTNFPEVAEAMGFLVRNISRVSDIDSILREIYTMPGSTFCNVEINPDQKLLPYLKFGYKLHEQFPQLDARKSNILNEIEKDGGYATK